MLCTHVLFLVAHYVVCCGWIALSVHIDLLIYGLASCKLLPVQMVLNLSKVDVTEEKRKEAGFFFFFFFFAEVMGSACG